MKPDYMRMEGQGEGPGTSGNIKLMVKLHMILGEMNKIAKKSSCRYNLSICPHFSSFFY